MLERDTSKLESVKAPFPRIRTTRRPRLLSDEGPAVRVRRRLRRRRRDGALGAVRSAGGGAPLSGGDQGVLHEAGSRAARHGAVRRRARARRLRRNHRRRAALDDYDLLLQRIEEHKLPREAFEWYLDLRRYGRSRTAASAWASSASSRGSAASNTCGRRSRIRACCIGCIRESGPSEDATLNLDGPLA